MKLKRFKECVGMEIMYFRLPVRHQYRNGFRHVLSGYY